MDESHATSRGDGRGRGAEGGGSPVELRALQSPMPMSKRLVVCAAVACLLPAAAEAQGIGFQAGATFDPEQFYVGSHIEFPVGSNQFVIRPSVTGAFGGASRMASISGDFIYRFDLGGTGWRLLQGLGPSVNIARYADAEITDVSGGWNYLIGVGNESGFFFEFKGGGSRGSVAPLLWIGVGFTVRPG